MNNVIFDAPISDNHLIRAEVRRVLIVQVGPTEYQITRFNTMRTANGMEEYGSPSGVKFDAAKGVYRWASNDHIPPATQDELSHGFDKLPNYNAETQNKVRSAETAAFLTEYRRANRNRKPSGEELFEMRAAFGRGTTVVNVLTGRRTRL